MKAALVPLRDSEYSFGVIGAVGGYPERATPVVAEVDPETREVTLRLADEGESPFQERD